ncbi:MAG: ferredoxin [Bacteroidales bacterium]
MIKEVVIEEGCIACGMCESICPEVFTIGEISEVNEGIDFSAYKEQILDAVDNCPVSVIKIEQ